MKLSMPPLANLERLLEEILSETETDQFAVNPLRVAGLEPACLRAPARPGARPRDWQQAVERELVEVHRTELAFLFREGARRCADWNAVAACSWRGLVEEALAAAHADELELSTACSELIGPVHHSAAPALDAVELARASLRLAEHPLGRLELARALRRRGEPHAASSVLAAALCGLAQLPSVLHARPWPDLICGLARAQERAGHPVRARLLRRWLPGRVA